MDHISLHIISLYILIRIFVADELRKLAEEGYGYYIDKEQMCQDKVLPMKKCFCTFVKKDIRVLDESISSKLADKECTSALYIDNFDKHMEDNMKLVAVKYTEEKNMLLLSPCRSGDPCKFK